jgi:hypothetical protein
MSGISFDDGTVSGSFIDNDRNGEFGPEDTLRSFENAMGYSVNVEFAPDQQQFNHFKRDTGEIVDQYDMPEVGTEDFGNLVRLINDALDN